MRVFGVTGTLGAGKKAFIDIAQRLRPTSVIYSTSDEVRRESLARGRTTARPELVRTANELRAEFGGGVLGERAAQSIHAAKPPLALVDGLRHPDEIEQLRQAFGQNFVLVAIDAPVELRYQRILTRQRAGEHRLTLTEFRASEEGELSAKPGFTQNIGACMRLADETLQNDGSLADFEKKVSALLEKYGA